MSAYSVRLRLYASGLTVLVLLVACGCETGYHAQGVLGDGFAEERLEGGDRWLVHFGASSFTSRERVHKYVLYRCAEIALANDSKYLVVIERSGGASSPLGPPSLLDSPGWSNPREAPTPSAGHREETVLLLLFRVQKPEGYATYYETRQLLRDLAEIRPR